MQTTHGGESYACVLLNAIEGPCFKATSRLIAGSIAPLIAKRVNRECAFTEKGMGDNSKTAKALGAADPLRGY
jgi:hypothetical protein